MLSNILIIIFHYSDECFNDIFSNYAPNPIIFKLNVVYKYSPEVSRKMIRGFIEAQLNLYIIRHTIPGGRFI